MLRIKAAQLEHFAGLARERFVTMMASFVREELPARVSSMNAAALTAWVRDGLALCERVGVTSEPEAAQLVLLLLVLGPTPEERFEWAPPILLRRDLSAEGKVRALIVAARAAGLPIDEVVRYPQYEAQSEQQPVLSELSET